MEQSWEDRGAAVSLRWFQVVLFCVAVLPPSLSYAASTGAVRVLSLLALLVLAVIVGKAVRWKGADHEVAALRDPWRIMVLLLLTGPGIMLGALTHILHLGLRAPRLYALPLLIALGFVLFRAIRRARPQGEERPRPHNPWLRLLLILVGLPVVTVYLLGFCFALQLLLPVQMSVGAVLLGAGFLVFAGGCLVRKIPHADGVPRQTLRDAVPLGMVCLGLPAYVGLLTHPVCQGVLLALPFWLMLLCNWLPMLLALGFSCYASLNGKWR